MNRHTHLWVTLFLWCCSISLHAKDINFLKGDFKQIAAEAKAQEKPFFVYFYGDWCPSCQLMKQTTFKDQSVVKLVDDHMIAAKVDIHNEQGKVWQNDFSVTCLPTTLFFDKDGNLEDRYEVPFTGSGFKTILNKHIFGTSPVYANQTTAKKYPFPDHGDRIEDKEIFQRNKIDSSISNNTITNSTNTLNEQDASSFTQRTAMHSKGIVVKNSNANLQAIMYDRAFLTVLRKHMQNLNNAQTSNAKTISLDEETYLKSCQLLLNDPEFMKELVSYLEQLEMVMEQNIEQKADVVHNQYLDQVHANESTIVSTASPSAIPLEEFQLPTAEERRRIAINNPAPNPVIVNTTINNTSTKAIPFKSSGQYYLQMGYFKNMHYAERLVSRLRNNHNQTEVTMKVKEVKGEFLYRVTMGDFNDRASAKSFGERVRKNGFKSYVMQH